MQQTQLHPLFGLCDDPHALYEQMKRKKEEEVGLRPLQQFLVVSGLLEEAAEGQVSLAQLAVSLGADWTAHVMGLREAAVPLDLAYQSHRTVVVDR